MSVPIDKKDPSFVPPELIKKTSPLLPEHLYWKYSLPLWAELSGIKVDSHDFSFNGHEYIFPLYNDKSEFIVLMKAAQMGATIWMILRAFHQALFYQAWKFTHPIKVGFYFPGDEGLNLLVKGRVEPLMRETPDLEKYCREKSRQLKTIDKSSIYFFYISGKSAKDSTPLMSAFFDEVRLMEVNDIEQAMERVSASTNEYVQLVSTAGLPSGDIHKFFLNSDQKWFTTKCEHCGYEQVLCLEFPDCIAEHTFGPRKGEVYYICKKCKLDIKNPQKGRYIPHGDPKHHISGYQVSQIMRKSAQELLTKFRDSTNRKEFYNSKLGIPYVDEESKPITIDMLDNFVNPLIEWKQPLGTRNFMGVDQMGNQNYVFVLSKGELSSKKRIVWFEIIDDRDPFKRTSQLMEDYNIEVCVCEDEPNKNDALRFARRFGKRVFLSKYGTYADMVRWQDSWKPQPGQKHAETDVYHQYRVFLDKYHSIERTLLSLRSGEIEWADPEKLIQEAYPYSGGKKAPMPIMRTHAYPMFASAVREKKERGINTGEYSWFWLFPGIDPHALMALNFALRASERRLSSAYIYTV